MKIFDKAIMKRHTELYTKGLMEFILPEIGARD